MQGQTPASIVNRERTKTTQTNSISGANINKLPRGGTQNFKRLWLGIIEQGLSLTEIFSISVVRN
jgi:hypothetical protein